MPPASELLPWRPVSVDKVSLVTIFTCLPGLSFWHASLTWRLASSSSWQTFSRRRHPFMPPTLLPKLCEDKGTVSNRHRELVGFFFNALVISGSQVPGPFFLLSPSPSSPWFFPSTLLFCPPLSLPFPLSFVSGAKLKFLKEGGDQGWCCLFLFLLKEKQCFLFSSFYNHFPGEVAEKRQVMRKREMDQVFRINRKTSDSAFTWTPKESPRDRRVGFRPRLWSLRLSLESKSGPHTAVPRGNTLASLSSSFFACKMEVMRIHSIFNSQIQPRKIVMPGFLFTEPKNELHKQSR